MLDFYHFNKVSKGAGQVHAKMYEQRQSLDHHSSRFYNFDYYLITISNMFYIDFDEISSTRFTVCLKYIIDNARAAAPNLTRIK